jgi:hypothetical protein
MDVGAMRTWGIAVSGAMMAAALAIALQPGAGAQTEPAESVETEASHAAFIVRFRGEGPIARAQARAAGGQLAEAQRDVEVQLQRQAAFAGLCFDRFTAGGAEIVLTTCEAIAASARADVEQVWLLRLQGMAAVEYVDANATATQ